MSVVANVQTKGAKLKVWWSPDTQRYVIMMEDAEKAMAIRLKPHALQRLGNAMSEEAATGRKRGK